MVLDKIRTWFSRYLINSSPQESLSELDDDKSDKPIEKKRDDELSIYFGYDYTINDKITVYQPTIGDIVEFGEEAYFSVAQTLTAIPSDMKSILYDLGIDYETIDDFQLFTMLSQGLTKKDTRLLLGDIDLSQFKIYKKKDNDEVVMYDETNDITIDKYVYLLISSHIRKMHGFQMKIEKAGNEFTKKILIQEDRDKRLSNKNKKFKSILKPLMSSMINSEGFKYKSNELKEVGLCEFMDSVRRISVIENTRAIMQGIYSGSIDQTKIKKSELNWMRELD